MLDDDIDPNDLLPEEYRRPSRGDVDEEKLIADLAEAQSKLTATDYHGALAEGKAAIREVLHRHGRVLADEID